MMSIKNTFSVFGIRYLLVGLIIGAVSIVPSWAQSKNPLYGFLVNVDSPFYHEGDTASVELNLFNFSGNDAYGSSGVGGVGCNFNIRVEDRQGTVLWQPGECRDGSFGGVVCPRIIVVVDLTDGSTVVNSDDIPLIQNNPAACRSGTNGEPIPAGVYRICVERVFNGPNGSVEQSFQGGLNPTACIPIRILRAPGEPGGF